MTDSDDLFEWLRRSAFRQRFHLREAERDTLRHEGLDAVMGLAAAFIARRLVPAEPLDEWRYTPKRGHPVFVAQHATATCCRGCLSKWHGIPKGHELTAPETAHVLAALRRWLVEQEGEGPHE